METDPLLAEQDRPAVLEPDDGRQDEQHRAEEDERGRSDDDVEQALDGDPEDPVGPVDQRQDLHAVEFLQVAARDDQGRLGDGDANDPALVLAESRDRLHERPVLEAEADRHFVDDRPMQDVLDLVHSPEDRPRQAEARCGRGVVWRGQVADRSQSQFDMPFDGVGELLCRLVGAHDEHVSGVVAACSQPDEEGPDGGPRDQCQDGDAWWCPSSASAFTYCFEPRRVGHAPREVGQRRRRTCPPVPSRASRRSRGRQGRPAADRTSRSAWGPAR